jgi:hypothetical protein
MLIQYLLIAILAGALVVTWRRERQAAIGRLAAVLWSLLWIGAAVVVLLPDVSSVFAKAVGVGRGVDAVVYLAILFLYYLVFRVFVRLEKIDRDITAVVRETGLRRSREGEKNDA